MGQRPRINMPLALSGAAARPSTQVPRRLGQLDGLPVEARVDAQLAAEPRRRLEAERLVEHVLLRIRRVVAGIFQLVEEGVRQDDVARRAGGHALARALERDVVALGQPE